MISSNTITRTDTLTFANKKPVFYSDFLDSFANSPVGGDLGRVINENAVTQSIINLINTVIGERLFQPTVGCGIYNNLFEINDNTTTLSITTNIQNTLKYFEPRCNLISVAVNSLDDYTILINITYSLINNPTPISISPITLRVR